MGVITSDGKRYVTYINKGDIFNPNKCKFDLNNTFLRSKPELAFWGSPENADFGWKEWCKSECFGDYDFNSPIIWHLKNGSKIFQIDFADVMNLTPENELLKYIDVSRGYSNLRKSEYDTIDNIKTKIKIISDGGGYYNIGINFKKMLSDGIDAVELMDSSIGHFFKNELETLFNSWDCESIVVLNNETIIFEEGV